MNVFFPPLDLVTALDRLGDILPVGAAGDRRAGLAVALAGLTLLAGVTVSAFRPRALGALQSFNFVLAAIAAIVILGPLAAILGSACAGGLCGLNLAAAVSIAGGIGAALAWPRRP